MFYQGHLLFSSRRAQEAGTILYCMLQVRKLRLRETESHSSEWTLLNTSLKHLTPPLAVFPPPGTIFFFQLKKIYFIEV